jgi:uncharacterized membrane protein YiaA
MHPSLPARPGGAFVCASWCALIVGLIAYLVGLWNAQMQLNEKGYYFAILLLGCFAAVSLQKTLRDRSDGQSVTGLYLGFCWLALAGAVVVLGIGLVNATLALSEKGFFAMSFVLILFAIVAVQKNVRDLAALDGAPAPGVRMAD